MELTSSVLLSCCSMYSLTMEGENSTMKSRMSIEAVFVFVSSAWTKKKSKCYRFVFFLVDHWFCLTSHNSINPQSQPTSYWLRLLFSTIFAWWFKSKFAMHEKCFVFFPTTFGTKFEQILTKSIYLKIWVITQPDDVALDLSRGQFSFPLKYLQL